MVLGAGIMADLLSLLVIPDLNVTVLRNAAWTLSNLCRGKNPEPSADIVSPIHGLDKCHVCDVSESHLRIGQVLCVMLVSPICGLDKCHTVYTYVLINPRMPIRDNIQYTVSIWGLDDVSHAWLTRLVCTCICSNNTYMKNVCIAY